jgi:SnoaL-like protein
LPDARAAPFRVRVSDEGECLVRNQQELNDIQDLTELTYRYAYAIDARDGEALRRLFVDDAEFDYGIGDRGRFRGADSFVSSSIAALSAMDATHHMFSNHLFTIDGDEAVGHYYMHAQHMKHDVESGGVLHTIGGRYDAQFVRRPDGWVYRTLRFTAIWGRGNAAVNPGFRVDEPSA